MKLNTFTADNVGSGHRQVPQITLNRKSSNSINKAALTQLSWTADVLIGLSQDADNPTDWYLHLAEGGFPLKLVDSGSTIFSSRGIANTVLDSLEIEDDKASFRIGPKPEIVDDVEYWPLITLAAKK